LTKIDYPQLVTSMPNHSGRLSQNLLLAACTDKASSCLQASQARKMFLASGVPGSACKLRTSCMANNGSAVRPVMRPLTSCKSSNVINWNAPVQMRRCVGSSWRRLKHISEALRFSSSFTTNVEKKREAASRPWRRSTRSRVVREWYLRSKGSV
jgi:hypothetical protein